MKYICMPLFKNVSKDFIIRHKGTRLTICPACGKECYETTDTRRLKKMPGHKAVCTECAIRAGLYQNK